MRPETKELTWERGTYCWADDCWNPIKPGSIYCTPTCANRTRRRRERYRHQLAMNYIPCRLCGATYE